METYMIDEIEANGVVLYEMSNAKHFLDTPTGKIGKKGWAQRIYMIIVAAGLLGWFLYSLIVTAREQSLGSAILEHLLAFFILLMAEAILIFTAFGLWGKFARGALRRNLKRKRGTDGAMTRQLEEELDAADANKASENAVRIYRDYVIVVNQGEKTLMEISGLQSVTCERIRPCEGAPRGYQLTFLTNDGTTVVAKMLLPVEDVPIVRNYFTNFVYVPSGSDKGYWVKKLPMIAFSCVPVLIGAALLILRALVLPFMPVIFGIVFLTFGTLFLISQFSEFAVVAYCLMPIGGGLAIMALPVGVVLTICDLVEELSLANVWIPFSPFHAVFSVFFAFGPLLFIAGIFGLINCTKIKR